MHDQAPRHRKPLPFPLDQRMWTAVIRRMKLPPQQAKIVAKILRDMSDEQIAEDLGIKESTIRTYLGRIFDRHEVQNRNQLVLRILALTQEINPPRGRR